MDGASPANRYVALTQGKTIWLTETGVLVNAQNPLVGGEPMTLERTRDEYLLPMVEWFNLHITVNGDALYLNAVAWFVTYDANTPFTNLRTADGPLTVVGEAWRDATCPDCECPGPDCLGGR